MTGPSGAGRWPTFLVIGAARCGTTALHGLLGQHHEVWIPASKEPNYFGLRVMGIDLETLPPRERLLWGNSVSDTDAYKALFDITRTDLRNLPPDRCLSPVAFGECSPVYLQVPGAAGLIRDSIPDCRLIVLLRDPVDRAISHHAHNIAIGAEEESDFERAFAADLSKGVHSEYGRGGLYAEMLTPYIELFGRDSLLLLTQRALSEDQAGTMQRVFAHIGVATDLALCPMEPSLVTRPSPVPDAVRGFIADYFRDDTRRLIEAYGFSEARAWSTA